jgi:DNA-binding response OmpR family regulator
MDNDIATSRILIVEDEEAIALIIRDVLRAEGHSVEVAGDGTTGLQRALEEPFDLLLLDVMLPDLSGYEICSGVRERGFEGAILMLTARGRVSDRVEGLNRGADDYLVKPFAPEELMARVDALLRRVHKKGLTPVTLYRCGDLVIDFAEQRILKNQRPLSLSAKEWELLRFLVNNRGQVLTRDTILKRVWGEQKFITMRTVDVHVAWLRHKIEEDPQAPRFILTVRGKGYRFGV